MSLVIINLCCSLIMAVCGFWLLTERSMPQSVRLFSTLIATGGSVNVLGMSAALFHLSGFVYGEIWPGEVIVNIGAAALMLRWTLLVRRRQHPAST
jgi:hypothetical protein